MGSGVRDFDVSTATKSAPSARPLLLRRSVGHETQGKAWPPRSRTVIRDMVEAVRRAVPRKSTRRMDGFCVVSGEAIRSLLFTRSAPAVMNGICRRKALTW